MIPGYQRDDKVSDQTNILLQRLSQFTLPILSKIVDTVPTIDTLPDGYGVRYVSGATYRLYFNINETIKFVALS